MEGPAAAAKEAYGASAAISYSGPEADGDAQSVLGECAGGLCEVTTTTSGLAFAGKTGESANARAEKHHLRMPQPAERERPTVCTVAIARPGPVGG